MPFIRCLSEDCQSILETRFYADIGQVYIIRDNGTWEPVPRPKVRNGRTGYSARIQGDAIIVDTWSGKKQKHMEMRLPMAKWQDVEPHDIFRAQHGMAESMIAEMAKRVFNENWGPHMNRQADKVVRAINKALEKQKGNHDTRT